MNCTCSRALKDSPYECGMFFQANISTKFYFTSSVGCSGDEIGVCMHNTIEMQNRSSEGCSKLKRSVDMTSSGKNGLNIRTNASPKWDRTRCPGE